MLILLIPVILLLLLLAERLLYRRFWNSGLSVRLDFTDQAADEGSCTSITEIVSNHSALPLPVVSVQFRLRTGLFVENGENVSVSDHTNVADIFSLGFYERITRKLPVRCLRRGYYAVEQTSVTASDLFGKELLYMNRAQRTQLYVYPRPFPEARLAPPLEKLFGELERRRALIEDPFSFRGIRAYTPQDPMNRINWKASAKAGSLLVNERAGAGSRRVLLFFNADPPSILYDEAILEEGLRLARSLADRLSADGVPAGFFSNATDILTGESARLPAGFSPTPPVSFYEMLSRVDLHTRGDFAETVEAALTADASDVTCVFISAAQRDDVADSFLRARTKTSSAVWFCPARADTAVRADIPGMAAVPC